MRRLLSWSWLVAAAAVITLAVQLSAQGGGAQADMAAINGVLIQLNRGYVTKDVAVLMSTMADDVQAYGSAFNISNLADFKTASEKVLATIIDARPASKQDVTLSGNLAYVNFLMDVQMKTDQGPRTGRTRWTVVFRKQNNKWAVTHFHVSRDPTM